MRLLPSASAALASSLALATQLAAQTVSPTLQGSSPSLKDGLTAGPTEGGGVCPPSDAALLFPVDATHSIVIFDGVGGFGPADPLDPCQKNDDDTTDEFPLQFTFDLYGTSYDSVYINNNGNISFGNPVTAFSPVGFPNTFAPMVAPLWCDVDTRSDESGTVWVKSEPNRLIVTWDDVGYYEMAFDKRNTFQLVITDGNDAAVGLGNNVCFSYANMDWTTGDASGGSGGLGGTPAVAGANQGNGSDFFQVGLFDQAGDAYDGPGGANDGVDYFDERLICFNTGVVGANTPPIALGLPANNTVELTGGTATQVEVQFIGPEVEQTVSAVVTDGGLANFAWSSTPGNPAAVTLDYAPAAGTVGSFSVTIVADDDGSPPLATTETIVFNVCSDPTVQVGCSDLLPSESLTLESGVPAVGESFALRVRDSVGATDPLATLATIAVSGTPIDGYPCGEIVPDFGLGGGPGELLINLDTIFEVAPLASADHDGIVINYDVFDDASLAGVTVYAQGFLVDTSVPLCALTAAMEIGICP